MDIIANDIFILSKCNYCGRESERYINLLLLLIIFKSRKLRVSQILESSFALSHILNVFSAPPYQMKPDQVVHQVVNTPLVLKVAF